MEKCLYVQMISMEICDYDVCELVYVQSGNWLKFSNLVLVGNTEACMKNE